MTISLISHPDCLEHQPGIGHPESSDRLSSLLTTLKNTNFAEPLGYLTAPMGTQEQVLLAHSLAHYTNIIAAAPESGQHSIDADTVMSTGTLNAALRGVGAACKGVDLLLEGATTTSSTSNVFCATRPPGHHSTNDQAMGFCFFNNIAIAALYAKHKFNSKRIAIIDFDVHHGNGTEDIIAGKKGILYISTHQSPLYPGSGSISANIPGNILNIPLQANTDDGLYQEIFTQQVLPALNAFKPDLILVSAGFDAHRSDPLAGLLLTEETYHWLGKQIKQVANAYSQGKILAVLEGGYNLDVLGLCASSFIKGLQ